MSGVVRQWLKSTALPTPMRTSRTMVRTGSGGGRPFATTMLNNNNNERFYSSNDASVSFLRSDSIGTHRSSVSPLLLPVPRYFGSAATTTASSPFLSSYQEHVNDRMKEAGGAGVAPKPLTAEQVSTLITELKDCSDTLVATELLTLLTTRVPPGVDEAAYVKASWLSSLALGKETSPYCSRLEAIQYLGTMQGGYNVATLVTLLEETQDATIAMAAAEQLQHTL